MYSPPGGLREPGETYIEAALREVEEEAGKKFTQDRLERLGRLEGWGPDWMPCGGDFFLLRLEPGEAEFDHAEPDQHGPWRAYPLDEAVDLPMPEITRALVAALRAGAQHQAPGVM